MSERRDFTHTAPSRPIVLRPHHPELEPQALVEPDWPRSHMTRRRIVYLVGLTLQAAVLAALVAAFLAYEAPIRAALGLAPPAPVAALGAEVSALAARVDALAATAAGESTLQQQVARIEEVVSRLADKLDAAGGPPAADAAGEPAPVAPPPP